MSNQPKKSSSQTPELPRGLEPAHWGRRIAALFIDWIASSLVLVVIGKYSGPQGTMWISAVFFVEVFAFTALLGGSFGQIALRMRVRRTDGTRLSPWAILVRTVLILLVVPPLIYKPDGRGLHDLAVNSAAYRIS